MINEFEEKFEIFTEETHDYLKRNSLFNKKKSELFLESQTKILELEKKWHIQKTSFFSKYSFSKKTFDSELEKIALLKNSPISYKTKLQEITTRLEKAKIEYKKNITISAENYNKNYNEIVSFYQTKLEKTRQEMLDIYNDIQNDISGKNIKLEQDIHSKISKFKVTYNEKVKTYNQAVKEFKLKKTHFSHKIKEETELLEKRKRTILSMKKTLDEKSEDLNATKQQFELESEIQLNELEEEKKKTIIIRSKIEKEKSDLIRLVLNIEISNNEEAERLLELSGKYTFDDLKKQYKKMALKYHPDTLSKNEQTELFFSKHMFQQVSKSYSILKEKFIF